MLSRVRTSLPVHPRTGLQAIGHGKRGPIWPVMGGAPDDGDTGGSGDAGAGDAAPPADTPPADGAGAPPAAPAGDLPTDPAALHAMIADLRKENASARTSAKATAAQEARDQLAQEIGKALGLVKGDETPDPAKLTEQLTATQAEARQARVELAVFRGASAHQGDPGALLDSRAFLTAVADLNPADAGFDKAVGDAIKAAVDANPKLKAVQAAGASGADHAGGSGEQRTRTPQSLDQATRAHYGTS